MPMTLRPRRLPKGFWAKSTARPRKGPRLAPKTKKAVTKIVKSVISRNTENQVIAWNLDACTQHNSPIGPADCVPVVQQITQGPTAQQRKGDRIKPKSLVVRGTIAFGNEDLNTAQDIYVRVVILAQKNIKVGSAIAGAGVDTAHLLRPGLVGADQLPFSGNTIDLNYPINRDLFRVYMDKVIKLTSMNVVAGAREANMGYSRRWSYRFKSLPANLTYDDGNGDWANNFAPFMAIGYAFSDCTAPDTVTTRLVSNVTSMLEYEDA